MESLTSEELLSQVVTESIKMHKPDQCIYKQNDENTEVHSPNS